VAVLDRAAVLGELHRQHAAGRQLARAQDGLAHNVVLVGLVVVVDVQVVHNELVATLSETGLAVQQLQLRAEAGVVTAAAVREPNVNARCQVAG
jgi:hypothetical protein